MELGCLSRLVLSISSSLFLFFPPFFSCFLCSSSSYRHLTLISESLPRVSLFFPWSLPLSSHISPVLFRFRFLLFLRTRPDLQLSSCPLIPLASAVFSPTFFPVHVSCHAFLVSSGLCSWKLLSIVCFFLLFLTRRGDISVPCFASLAFYFIALSSLLLFFPPFS